MLIEDLTIPKPEGRGEGIIIGIWAGNSMERSPKGTLIFAKPTHSNVQRENHHDRFYNWIFKEIYLSNFSYVQ